VPRHADAEALERAAQAIADTMTQFVQRHPTQWFAFQPGSAGEET
jgi:lauroyl/myristoyl acyltransferase